MKRFHKHDLHSVRFYFANYTKWNQTGPDYVNKTRDDEGCHVQLGAETRLRGPLLHAAIKKLSKARWKVEARPANETQ
eukprot:8617857-Pyramimonas_sp.AAC.1